MYYISAAARGKRVPEGKLYHAYTNLNTKLRDVKLRKKGSDKATRKFAGFYTLPQYKYTTLQGKFNKIRSTLKFI